MTSRRSLPPGSRGLRLAGAPAISVVVVSGGPRVALESCLAALVPACRARAVEVVVARACPTPEFRSLQLAWPTVLWMPAADGAGMAALRIAGMSAAEGDIVAIVDDGFAVTDGWVAELAESPRRARQDASG